MISPDEYALAVAKGTGAPITARIVEGENHTTLYEIYIGDRLVERVSKEVAVAFLDGVIAGYNIGAGR